MNIAIIDDTQEILDLLEKFLVTKGHKVTTYLNPITAISSLASDTDIVLLDVIMPQMNGLDALPKILKKNSNTKVIIMTSQSTLDKVLDAHRHGAVHYVMKPFKSLNELESKLKEL